MESEKRKRQDNGEEDGRRTKAREDDVEETETAAVEAATATEAEVEEFFAILRRLHSAVRSYQRDGVDVGKGRKVTVKEKRPSWKPAFEWGDFEETNGVRNREKREEGVEESLAFDLNADPTS